MAHMFLIRMAVVTNIELDHRLYRDEQHVTTPCALCKKIAKGGVAPWCRSSLKNLGGEEIEGARSAVENSGCHCREHNRENAPWRGGITLGVDGEDCESARIIYRIVAKVEHLGMYNGADVYTDYAHHPTALRRLVEGAREFLPNRRIVLCFQPHQHARTKGLFDAFVGSMDGADTIILPEIYGVAGRSEGETDISSAELVEAIKKHDARRGVERSVCFAANFNDAKAKIDGTITLNDVLLLVWGGGHRRAGPFAFKDDVCSS